MQVKVMNEAGFQILTSAMSIGPSQSGYVLEVSADGKNFSPLFSVAANTTKMATGLAPNAYYRLKGNVGEVIVNWSRSCVTEGGAAGNELTPVTEFPLNADPGTVVALASGDTVSVYQYDGENWNEVGGNTEDIELPIAAAVNDLKGNIEVRLNQKYYTKQEVNDIAAGKTDPDQVGVQIQEYVDPAIAEVNETIGEVNETIVDKELPVSAALNDLNTNKVSGVGITKIQSISQADYDALAVKDPTTFYIIANN